jgi:L-ascorbate metabolism protein UlaG (beta-lactamase superfamily)
VTTHDQITRLTVEPLGGPTAILEYAGLRWLTDPAFSPPGEYAGLVKTAAPAVPADAIGSIDVVLLSHDHHSDNLDPGGRAYLPRAGQVLTTAAAARRLGGNTTGVEPWSSVDLTNPQGSVVTATAVPAQHGPDGSDEVMGPVIGFLLQSTGCDTVYVSGGNASLEVVREIADRAGPIGVAILFAGAVQRPSELDCAYLTLSSDHAADAAKLLGVHTVVPLHYEGWTHFTQGARELRSAFAGNGISDRLALAEPGIRITV